MYETSIKHQRKQRSKAAPPTRRLPCEPLAALEEQPRKLRAGYKATKEAASKLQSCCHCRPERNICRSHTAQSQKNTYRCSIKNRSLQSWRMFELAHIVCRATTVARGNTVHSRFQEPVAMRPTEYFPNQTMPPPHPHLILCYTLSRNLRQ